MCSVAKSCLTPWTAACHAPLSMEFPRQQFWMACHFLLQGIFPTQRSNHLLHWHMGSLPLSHQGSTMPFSRWVVSNSLWPHGLQHARLPCPSLTPRVYSNSCPLSMWWHPIISSSVICFSSHLQSFPASVSFPMSQFFSSGGQSIGVSASASVLPMNIQDWFSLGLTGLILQSKGLSRVFSNTTVQKPCLYTR